MKPLTIKLAKGKPRQFKSIGWKTPNQFYALDRKGKPWVITLKPASLKFPEAVCVEVSPYRLLPPPCYPTGEEFDRQLPLHSTFEPWKAIYWKTHHEFLALKRSDDRPLQKRLNKWKASKQKEFEYKAAALHAQIERVTTATLQELGFDTEKQRAERLVELHDIAHEQSDYQIRRLSLTLAEVKLGHEGIRDAYLHQKWAKKNGENLGVMARERLAFRRSLERYKDMPDLGENYEDNPQFLEACASVLYRARFADSAKTHPQSTTQPPDSRRSAKLVVYLADCELREELTSRELDEVAKLSAVTQTIQAADWVNLRPSPNYRQLSWTDGGKKERANLTPNQAAAFSALHHADGFILAREEWQQEIYGNEPLNDFRPDKIFGYKDGPKVWRRFIRVDGDRYRLVIERE